MLTREKSPTGLIFLHPSSNFWGKRQWYNADRVDLWTVNRKLVLTLPVCLC